MQTPSKNERQQSPAGEDCGAPSIWVRSPVGKATCAYTGLRHAQFYAEFYRNPRIRQCRLGRGKSRGTRLLWLPDIYAELSRRADAEQLRATTGE